MRVGAVGPGSLLGPCLWGRLASPSGARGLAGRGARAPREGTGYLWRQPPESLQHLAGPFPEGHEAFLSGPGAVPLCGAVGERLGGQKCVRKAGKRWRLEIWQVSVPPGASRVMG